MSQAVDMALFHDLQFSGSEGPILEVIDKFTINMNEATKESLDNGVAKIKAYNDSLRVLIRQGREVIMDSMMLRASEALKMRPQYAEWLAKVSSHITYPGTFIGDVFTDDKGFQHLLKQSDEAGVTLRKKIVDVLQLVRPIGSDSTAVVCPKTGSFLYVYLPIDKVVNVDLEKTHNFQHVMTTINTAMEVFGSARGDVAAAARYFLLKGKNEYAVEIPRCLKAANDLASGKIPKVQPWETAADSSSTTGMGKSDLELLMARFGQLETTVVFDASADMAPCDLQPVNKPSIKDMLIFIQTDGLPQPNE